MNEVGGDATDMLNLLDTIVTSYMTSSSNRLIVQCRYGVKQHHQKTLVFGSLFSVFVEQSVIICQRSDIGPLFFSLSFFDVSYESPTVVQRRVSIGTSPI